MQVINRIVRSAVVVGFGSVMALSSASAVQAAPLSKDMEDKLVAVCQAIKDDNRLALRRAVDRSGVKYTQLARGLVCDGMDMYSFAMHHGADKTGSIIAERTRLDEQYKGMMARL
ncbi:DUF3718 domain-containing protein [Alteromonas gilva]|uniref:DUF3718 domain-containing protein n=1 Tax=Alteromonas gilva TaxID=2987522 RepID=A0ABT5KZG0_9ALTE|nr:DUF3718 domain-containing protein [Alteromonas gilva]MDC8830160.1 DUF3718 domain-containing protein [Alteromonas gilva]